MKNNLKIKALIVMLLLITFISLTGIVNAASVNMSLNSSSKLKAGDVVTVTLKISSIDAGDGIDAIVATLDYDKNVFEEVTEDSFEGINKWNVNVYSTDTQMFTVTKSSKVNSVSDILKISLKVKDTISVDSTEIKLKDITASGGAVDSGGTGDIEIKEASVKIAKDTSTNKPITNIVENTTTNTAKNEIVNTVNKVSNTSGTAGGKLPQTGESIIGITAGTLIISIIAIIAYIKYRNINIK